MGIILGGNTTNCALWVPGMRIIGGQRVDVSEKIRKKIRSENRINLGSTEVPGRVFDTTDYYYVQDVLNAYLRQPLTENELEYILSNREKFVFCLGVGDRRDTSADLIRRFVYVDNWHGEDVRDFSLAPEVFPSQPYNFRLLFDSRARILRLTDTHAWKSNKYGALRALYVTERNN
ncbi:hypothetical protein NGB58_04690 [Escherichia coli]|nr:hypothetical protein [Escherichia coli]